VFCCGVEFGCVCWLVLVIDAYECGVVTEKRDRKMERAVLLSHFFVVLIAVSSCCVLNMGQLLFTEL